MRWAVLAVGLGLGLGLAAAAPVPAALLEVEVLVAGALATEEPVEVTVTLSPIGDDQETEPRILEITTGLTVELELPADSRWRIDVRAPGYWCAGERLELPAEGASVSQRLHPTGTIQGRLEGPKSALRHLRVRLKPAVAAPARPLPCDMGEGLWHCTVPAGTYDLAFEVDGLAAIRRWGVTVDASATVDLGLLHFRPGTSIFGRVEIEGGDPPSESWVELRTAGSLFITDGADPAVPLDASTPSHPARVTASGNYQLLGVAKGTFVVVAADENRISRPSPTLAVSGEPREFQAPPLLLQTPGTLEIVFDPPVDPFEETWIFELSSLDLTSRKPLEIMRGGASEGGGFRRERLLPGPYHLVLIGHFDPAWTAMEFELGTGELFLTVSPSLVGVRGSSSLGREPLPGTVRFHRAQPKNEVTLVADYNGSFAGFLPSEGLWQVEVSSADGELTIDAGSVEVEVARGESLAEVALLVPGTEIHGQVVDEQGEPVPGARVRIIWQEGSEDQDRTAMVGADGRFRIIGLPTGSAAVRAEAPPKRPGPWVHLILEEDREIPELLLRTQTLP